jgi:3-oxoadipate enol-lactonase
MEWADVNGVSLRYELQGNGPVLVLLHEMGGTLESWDGVVSRLSGRTLLRFDSRGAGLSQKISGVAALDDLTADLEALLDRLGIDTPVAVAGVAVGAAVALRFAARRPSRVSAVFAMALATGIPPERRQATLDLADRYEREGMRVRVLERIDHSFPAQYRTDPALFASFLGRALSNDPRSYAAIYRMLANMELDQDLPKIACPAMVLAGATDQTRPASVVREVAARIPHARFLEIVSGHVMPMLTPELVARHLDAFLTEVGMPAAQNDKISSVQPAKLV